MDEYKSSFANWFSIVKSRRTPQAEASRTHIWTKSLEQPLLQQELEQTRHLDQKYNPFNVGAAELQIYFESETQSFNINNYTEHKWLAGGSETQLGTSHLQQQISPSQEKTWKHEQNSQEKAMGERNADLKREHTADPTNHQQMTTNLTKEISHHRWTLVPRTGIRPSMSHRITLQPSA